MRCVLGIDAAWTAASPSGCALVVETETGWRLVSCAASYDQFAAAGTGRPADLRARGSIPDVTSLTDACVRATGRRPDLVAIDMPLALVPITSRRVSDQAVSRHYGGRGSGTHTPNATRPGPIGDAVRAAFASIGYPLLVDRVTCPGLMEVYPHPALIELASAPRRLPYKIQKTARYWPGLPVARRRENLLAVWADVVSLLDARISGVATGLPPPTTGAPTATLKSYEDMLDAVVCAWVGTRALAGQATPFRDKESAIWIPTSA